MQGSSEGPGERARGRVVLLAALFVVGSITTVTAAVVATPRAEDLPAEFAPPHSHTPIDTDGDGRYNYLAFDVNISVSVAQTYYLQGFLRSGAKVVSPAFNRTTLDTGQHTVRLVISGARFQVAGLNGPYTMELDLYVWSNFTIIDYDNHTTEAYSSKDFDPPAIDSPFTSVVPSIDGVMSPGEWADAHVNDLSTLSGNYVPGLFLVKDDNARLYVAYDATGDVTRNLFDTAAIGFDTYNDGLTSDKHEDQFDLGGNIANEQAHLVYSSAVDFWVVDCTPFDETLPDHSGLEGAWGYGRSDASGTLHRVYEFAIPMALLRVVPGDTIGFFGGSQASPGLYDESADGYSAWPEYGFFLRLVLYGDLLFAPDLTKPAVAITSPAPGSALPTGTVTLDWTASDVGLGLDHIEVAADGGQPVVLPRAAKEYTFVGLPDALHELSVTAFDRAGNSRIASVSVITDTIAPAVAISHPTEGAILASTSVEISWTASDATSGVSQFQARLDGGAPVVLAGTLTSVAFDHVLDGAHAVVVSAYDRAGNTADDVVSFTIDSRAPSVELLAPASGSLVAKASLDIRWSAQDLGGVIARFEVSLDGSLLATLPATANAFAIETVEDGVHAILVTAFDRAGNLGSASADVTVDTQQPDLTVSLSEGTAFPVTTVPVGFSTSDQTSGIDRIEVFLDGERVATLGPTGRGVTLSGLLEGSHSLRATAFDRAGNFRTVSRSFTVDTTAPLGRIEGPVVGGLVSSSDVPVSWAASDASGTASVDIRLDGGEWTHLTGASGVHVFPGLADGQHVVALRVSDAAGNVVTLEAQFRVDTAVLSPSGPYGVAPLAGIAGGAAVAAILAALLVRRRRGRA